MTSITRGQFDQALADIEEHIGRNLGISVTCPACEGKPLETGHVSAERHMGEVKTAVDGKAKLIDRLNEMAKRWCEQGRDIERLWPGTGLPIEGTQSKLQADLLNGCAGDLLKVLAEESGRTRDDLVRAWGIPGWPAEEEVTHG